MALIHDIIDESIELENPLLQWFGVLSILCHWCEGSLANQISIFGSVGDDLDLHSASEDENEVVKNENEHEHEGDDEKEEDDSEEDDEHIISRTFTHITGQTNIKTQSKAQEDSATGKFKGTTQLQVVKSLSRL